MIQHYPMVRFLVRSVLLWANEPGLEKSAWTGIALTSTGEILADILGDTSLLISRESSASESLSEAKTSVAGLQSLNSPLVKPIITPRLIEETLKRLIEEKSQRQRFFSGLFQLVHASFSETSVISPPANVSTSRSNYSLPIY